VAFDTGPANVLIDIVMGLLTDGLLAYDEDGAMAARGRVVEAWLDELLAHPYYAQPPPKTTGRELFSPAMGAALLAEGRGRGLADADIVATLTALSGASVADQYRRFLPAGPDEVVVAGGGARNRVLMAGLRERLPHGVRLMTLACARP
jgi:anhydro-N-acetylmuramic acid kinase